MGFRSTFTSTDLGGPWPQWFLEKWAGDFWFRDRGGPLAPIRESVVYGRWDALPGDIQRVLKETGGWRARPFVLLFLHECGGVSRCQIDPVAIRWSEPRRWEGTSGVTHDYCYGCSDVREE
jgi:hypothetical protein